MVVYSIKDMENISGVKAHTIRIWEKRYGIINPKRTESNIRYYTDEDLRRLLNVCLLYKNGHKISKIAKMSESEIQAQVNSYSSVSLGLDDKLDALMLFILDLDSYNFNKVLDQNIDQIGLEESMIRLIYPLLDKIGLAWLSGSFTGVHESFVTQIIKGKIQKCIEDLEDQNDFEPCYLIFLSEGEKEELSLLYLHYLLKKNKCHVVNLGLEVALKDVILAMQTLKPDYVFTIVNREIPRQSLQNYVNQISKNLLNSQLILTGYQVVSQVIEWPESVRILRDLNESISFIQGAKISKQHSS